MRHAHASPSRAGAPTPAVAEDERRRAQARAPAERVLGRAAVVGGTVGEVRDVEADAEPRDAGVFASVRSRSVSAEPDARSHAIGVCAPQKTPSSGALAAPRRAVVHRQVVARARSARAEREAAAAAPPTSIVHVWSSADAYRAGVAARRRRPRTRPSPAARAGSARRGRGRAQREVVAHAAAAREVREVARLEAAAGRRPS